MRAKKLKKRDRIFLLAITIINIIIILEEVFAVEYLRDIIFGNDILKIIWAVCTFWGIILVFTKAVLPVTAIENYMDKLTSTNLKSGSLYVRVCEVCEKLDSYKKKYQKDILNKQAEFLQLQGQINPHFLYNTLETIRYEAMVNGINSVAEMIKRLSLFFRYSISKNENIVTLRREVENVENYFAIQQYRFGDKISLKVNIDQDCSDKILPKIILQPIVENALFYGIEPQVGGGTVEITAFCTPTRMIVRISDDGIGMVPQKLSEVRRALEHSDEKQMKISDGNGIALANVNKRIKLFFGDVFEMRIESVAGIGTDVILELPNLTQNNLENMQGRLL